ncbi:MAG: hypothetical protein HN392_02780 [Anaerolineae bacterium]|nr:hypothetical protein [Anaerolineae bacterium]MBT7074136.1 hypothetical protein [Anaerolineae bacterium]MBT7781313.1 hypothetical protein [Anaerolineae bacterium]
MTIRKILILGSLIFTLFFSGFGCVPVVAPTPVPADTATTIPPTIEPTSTEVPMPTFTPSPEPTLDTGYDEAILYDGRWEGKWTNTTFGSEGPIEIDIEIEPDGTMEFSLDVDGFVFGLLDPDPVVYIGAFDANGAEVVIVEDPIWGDVTLSFSKNGDFKFDAALVPDVEIVSMLITGVFTEEGADGDYLIKFVGEDTADGFIELNKVAE